ncbi:DUF302 domain-containing protein [Geopsychrobacter electrodiphilus]|uniref:DUF302 domain-containing protein n=1 Tax=Geopsychrobacter electrodiphilus TaxID=225196 RepID=UPI0003A4825F
MQATLKKKRGVDFTPDRILGSCNSHLAYQALQVKPRTVLRLKTGFAKSKINPVFNF